MNPLDLVEKFAQNGVDVTVEDAAEILKHMPNADACPDEVFNESNWTFISTDEEVLSEFTCEYFDSNEDIDWEDYLDDAIDAFCEENGMELIVEGDDLVFVSDDLIQAGYVTDQPVDFTETVRKFDVYD